MNPTRAVFQFASVKAQKTLSPSVIKPPSPLFMLEGNITISYEKHLHNIESGGLGEKQRRRQKWFPNSFVYDCRYYENRYLLCVSPNTSYRCQDKGIMLEDHAKRQIA